MHAAPARREVVAELVDEHEHAEHDDEGDGRCGRSRECMQQRSAFRSESARSCVRPQRGLRRSRCGRRAARAASSASTSSSVSARRRAHAVEHAARPYAAMSRKPIRRCRNASTATSLAALRMVGAPPPARKASRARRSAGKRTGSGAVEVEPAERREVEPRRAWSASAPARPACARSGCACRARRAAPARCRPGSRRGRGSPIADAPARRSASRRRPNSRAASISSSPLFIMVARVDADLGAHRPDRDGAAPPPASRGAISSRLAVRNGPPEAVSTICSTAPRLPSASAWKIALCSESTGSSVAPASRTARSITSPAQTSASLLASATAPPRRIAASVDGRPAAPVIAAIVQSAGSAAAATTASAPPAVAMPVPASAARSVGMAGGIGDHGELGAERARLLGQQRRVAAADQRAHPEAVGLAGEQVDRLRADAAGAAQDASTRSRCRSLPQHYSPARPASASSAATGAAASTRPAGRAGRHGPGSGRPESLTPKCRLIALSSRSPACDDDAEQRRDRRQPGRAAAPREPAPRPPARPAIAASRPPTAPAQVLPGEIAAPACGPPSSRPASIGADVARPDHQHQEQHVGPPGRRRRRAARSARSPAGRRTARRRPASRPAGPSPAAAPTAATPAATAAAAPARAPRPGQPSSDQPRRHGEPGPAPARAAQPHPLAGDSPTAASDDQRGAGAAAEPDRSQRERRQHDRRERRAVRGRSSGRAAPIGVSQAGRQTAAPAGRTRPARRRNASAPKSGHSTSRNTSSA